MLFFNFPLRYFHWILLIHGSHGTRWFHKQFYQHKSNSMESSLCCYLDSSKAITTKFCTSVVVWAKIYWHLMTSNRIMTSRMFHKMLFASKVISEMDPGMIIAVDESMKNYFHNFAKRTLDHLSYKVIELDS